MRDRLPVEGSEFCFELGDFEGLIGFDIFENLPGFGRGPIDFEFGDVLRMAETDGLLEGIGTETAA